MRRADSDQNEVVHEPPVGHWWFWQSNAPVERATVEGSIEHMFSKKRPGESGCICCPNGRHRFGAILHTERGMFSSYHHLDDFLGGINSFVAQHGLDGRRVRITVELLPEGVPALVKRYDLSESERKEDAQ